MQNQNMPEIGQTRGGDGGSGSDIHQPSSKPQDGRVQLLHDAIKKALPPRFSGVSPNFELLHSMQKGKSYLLTGSVGTGKTRRLIEALYAHLYEKYIVLVDESSVPTITEKAIKKHFMTVTEVLRKIKAEFDRPQTESIIDVMIGKEFLFLDDLGSEKASEWVKEQLYSVINERYNWMRPVFITTNLTMQEIANNYGDRFASRIVEMCEIVKISGADHRIKKQI